MFAIAPRQTTLKPSRVPQAAPLSSQVWGHLQSADFGHTGLDGQNTAVHQVSLCLLLLGPVETAEDLREGRNM